MQDRELLELAAKAAGMPTRDDYSESYGLYAVARGADGYDGWRYWNPLTDDGDALRLAVKLGMRVSANRDPAGFTAIASVQSPFGAKSATESADPETLSEATRRAIVRAAAEVGKAA